MVSLPLLDGLMQKVESYNTKKHIMEALRQAKIQSKIRQKDVIVCATDHLLQCNQHGQSYIRVFVDINYNNRFDDKDIVVYNQPIDLRFGSLQVRTSLSRGYMKFMGDSGKPRGNFGHFRYCNFSQNHNHHFQVVVNSHGYISERTTTNLNVAC